MDKARLALNALHNISIMCSSALTSVDPLPAIEVGGINLQITSAGKIDLSGLSALYPSLAEEWTALTQVYGVAGFGPYPDNDSPLLVDTLCFLDARVTHSEADVGGGSWLPAFRNSVMGVLATMFEVRVGAVLTSENVPLNRLQIHELRSAASGRRCRRGVLEKMQILRKSMTHGGSANACIRLLSDQRGLASVVRNLSNKQYEHKAAASMINCRALSVNWDGATYSGYNVNIALALDCMSGFGCHMRPTVHILFTLNGYFI